MKMNKLAALLAASTMVAASSAMAWESEDGMHSTSASVALSSDYMWRGASQTDNEMAISGSFDYGHASGLYAGAWASNVEASNRHIEVNVYTGYANEIGDTGIGYDVGFRRYIFDGDDGTSSRTGAPTRSLGSDDWNEYSLGLSYSHFSLTVSHTEDFNGTDEEATHYLLGFNHALPYDMHLHAGYAFYDFDDEDAVFGSKALGQPNDIDNPLQDYAIGVSKDMAGFTWDVTWYETLEDGKDATENARGSDNTSEGRFVFTVSKSL